MSAAVFQVLTCGLPVSGGHEALWMAKMIVQNELDRIAWDLEQDTQWEIDNGFHDEAADIESVPIELLPEIQRC